MGATSIPSRVPILPSTHLVFFPRTHLSVHIPRSFYDQMQENAVADASFLGIVLRKAEPSGEAAFLPIGCVGKVIHFHLLPCGGAVHLDLHGVKRFRVIQGRFEEGYGEACIEVIEDPPGDLSPPRKKLLLDMIHHLARIKALAPHVEERIQAGIENDEVLVNLLCQESNLSPTERYFLLEAEDLNQRCGRLLDLLRFRMEEIRTKGVCPKDQ